jgi:hypothetical protein
MGKARPCGFPQGDFVGRCWLLCSVFFAATGHCGSVPGTPGVFYAPPPVATLPSPAPPALFCCRRRSLRSLPRHPRQLVPHFHAVLGIVTHSHVITGLDPVIHVAGTFGTSTSMLCTFTKAAWTPDQVRGDVVRWGSIEDKANKEKGGRAQRGPRRNFAPPCRRLGAEGTAQP